VGITSPQDLQSLIENQAKSSVYLTVLGFGMGNLKDATMERLADHGNGNYGYIDNTAEAKKLLVDQMTGTLVTIAKDVKIQVEFNPAQVAAYRLIGYENRRMANRDFHNDAKDAGEIGAGHSVTALYELVPQGVAVPGLSTAVPLRYQPSVPLEVAEPNPAVQGTVRDELLAVRLRYKEPDAQNSRLLQVAVIDRGLDFPHASADFRFASAVAQFGMLLTNSSFRGDSTYDHVIETAASALGDDPKGYRAEFLALVSTARNLTNDQRLFSKRD
jgi:Ca-activated chloride channel family protein